MPSKKEWYDRPINTLIPKMGTGHKTRSSYQLTTLGRSKAESGNLAGVKGSIVMALDNADGVPCNSYELSNSLRISRSVVKQALQGLIADGWVRQTSGNEGE